MDTFVRLQMLTSQMELEPAEESHEKQPARTAEARPDCFYNNFTTPKKDVIFVHPAQLPDGKHIKLLKTLLTSVCEKDCFYCPFRAGRDFRRATFKPEEFAKLFLQLNESGIAEGVFLSSGIAGGGMHTQDKLIDTADILRHKLKFR